MTASMYQEWLRDALGLEHRHDAEFAHAHREASRRGAHGPVGRIPGLTIAKQSSPSCLISSSVSRIIPRGRSSFGPVNTTFHTTN